MPPPPLAIDAGAHVLESQAFFGEVLKRFKDHSRVSGGDRPAIVIEGRRYPETEGPGAGCPPRRGRIDPAEAPANHG